MKKNSPHPKRALILLYTLFVGLFLFSACSKKPVGKTQTEEVRYHPFDSIQELPAMDSVRKAPLSFDMSLKAVTPEKTRRLNASMRMAPDSIIWASVAPSFGIEVARVLFRGDSLFMIERMNDRYFRGKPAMLGQRFGIPLERSLLESALLGKPAVPHEKGFTVYKGAGDTLHYRPVMSRELEAHLGLEAPVPPFDTVRMEPPSVMRDSLDRLQSKEGVRYLPFYWAADSGKVLTRFSVIDLQERTVIDLRYPSYRTLDSAKIPSRIKARVRSRKGISTFEMEIDGLQGSDPSSYPFSIPDGYAPIRP